MQRQLRFITSAVAVSFTLLTGAAFAQTQQAPPTPPAQEGYQPKVGQAGKDAVWVPTSPELVQKMLDLAKLQPSDFVIDLGSGDGRNIIAAAKRGVRGRGVEFNQDLVDYSNKLAKSEGVGDKATFVQGDMYAADISEATVLALFLLPQNLDKLADKFLDLKPGSRIVANTFGMTGWKPDVSEQIGGDCTNWCTALLWIVPAKVQGSWAMPQGELKLVQSFQKVSGSLGAQAISEGKLQGDELTFKVGTTTYTGKVNGNTIQGSGWTATKK